MAMGNNYRGFGDFEYHNQNTNKDLRMIAARSIKPSPYNKGLNMDRVQEYAESMKTDGLISPIVLYDLEDGTFEILTGHQRFEAWCNVLGHTSIKASVIPYEKDPEKRFIAHTRANTMTRELNINFWTSRLRMAIDVLHEKGFTGNREEEIQEISKWFGMSRAQIYRYLGFDNLIPALQEFETKKWLSVNTLYIASALPEEKQKTVAERVLVLYKRSADDDSEFEITRDVFKQICDDVKNNGEAKTPPKEPKQKMSLVDTWRQTLSKSVKKIKNEEDKEKRLEELAEIRAMLNQIEEDIVSIEL